MTELTYANYKIDDLRWRIHSAISTAVACDVIGTNLLPYDKAYRGEWFPMTRKQAERRGVINNTKALPQNDFPQLPEDHLLTDDKYFKSESLIKVLEVITATSPLDSDDLLEVLTDFSEQEFAGEVSPWSVGSACAFYCALNDLDSAFLEQLVFCAWTGLDRFEDDEAFEIAHMVSKLVYQLCETGFFDSGHLQSVMESVYGSVSLQSNLYWMSRYALNAEVYTEYTEPPYFLDGHERVLYEVFWYLMRISTQYKTDDFSTVPKECIPEILSTDVDVSEIFFLFGILCVLSERTPNGSPYKLIIPESLTSKTPFQERLEEVLKYL